MPLYPKPLFQLIQLLKKLPGVGQKTAERYAFHLLDWPQAELKLFSHHLFEIKEKITRCQECGVLKESSCPFCIERRKQSQTLCIVSSAKDVFSLEETRLFDGLYHVLPSLLNPFDDQFNDQIDLQSLLDRIHRYQITEIILAIESTLEGDATALYLKEKLSSLPIKLSRLAYGIPLGSTLEYIDGGTLSKALTGRQPF